MAILSQGSQVYVLAPTKADPSIFEVLTVPSATAFTPGGNPADQIEVTTLEDRDSRRYRAGLRTPGQASLTVNFDPSEAAHIRMFELSQMNPAPTLKWALGWSDGTEAPTVAIGGYDFVLSTARTWYTFEGYLSDVPFDMAANAVVTSAVTIQRSGAAGLTMKAA
ncbi:MAG TPA: phage tail protein [Pseudomonas xinjiangensis]|uniref:Phage tail protein n=2 Tax=root TaxID=1 RepID=A0A7V1BLF9_9GAMM|nr:phage tail protein [Halopseudomonas xinjiangensis]HEC47153.1 phage tail protein [Halopseudomonas xinjiangensis]